MAELRDLPLTQLQPNPWNRTVFDPQALEDLVASIKAEGIREPLKVRKLSGDNPEPVYQIASGHRRWLAAQKVGIKEIPCLIETLSDEQVAEDNITINIQREALPALDLARMLAEYMKTYDKNQPETAKVYGKTQSWVSQYIGFLDLDPSIKNITAVMFSMMDLRALKQLSLKDQHQIAKELEGGTLKPDGIQKRCHQLRFTAQAPRYTPPDPLEQVWSNLKKSPDVSPEKWNIHHSIGKWVLTVNAGSDDPIGVLYRVLRFLADHIPGVGQQGKGSKENPYTREEYEAMIRSAVPKDQADAFLKRFEGSKQPASKTASDS